MIPSVGFDIIRCDIMGFLIHICTYFMIFCGTGSTCLIICGLVVYFRYCL